MVRRSLRTPLALFAGALVSTLFVASAAAHDSWISRGAFTNNAGEWCCGTYDCPTLNYTPRVTAGGYQLENGEVIPFSETMPSPDGTYVRCHRPDGTRRCFFAPPPGT